jgi:hypothetical protein
MTDSIHLAQDTAKRHTLVNTVMNLQPPYHMKTTDLLYQRNCHLLIMSLALVS